MNILKPGFYFGSTGILFLKLISDKRINLDEFDKSLSELDKTDYSFSRGISGIGWAMQILIENDCLSKNYNVLLESFDDLIYKDVVNKKNYALSMFSKNSLLGKALYLYQRITSSPNKIIGFYNNVACKECLVLLISEISSVISVIIENNKQSKILYTNPIYFLEIGQGFLFLYLCFRANISKDFISKKLRYLKSEIESLLIDKTIVINNENASFYFYLLYTYAHVATDIKDSGMVNNSRIIYHKLIPTLQLFWIDTTNFELKKRLDIKIGICDKTTVDPNLYRDDIDTPFYLWNKLSHNLSNQGIEYNLSKAQLLKAFLLE